MLHVVSSFLHPPHLQVPKHVSLGKILVISGFCDDVLYLRSDSKLVELRYDLLPENGRGNKSLCVRRLPSLHVLVTIKTRTKQTKEEKEERIFVALRVLRSKRFPYLRASRVFSFILEPRALNLLPPFLSWASVVGEALHKPTCRDLSCFFELSWKIRTFSSSKVNRGRLWRACQLLCSVVCEYGEGVACG